MARNTDLAAEEAISQRIYVIRGQQVLLDSDLAALYGVATKRFNEAVATRRAPSPNMGPSWLPSS
jgi:hypothetical protein